MLGCVLAVPFVVGCSDDVYLMIHEEVNYGDGWINLGGGCELLKGKGSSVTGSADSVSEVDDDYFRMETVTEGKSATVTLTTKSEEVVREYDNDFLLSGEVDVVEITTDSGTVHRASFWGGAECDSPWGAGGDDSN